MVMGWVCQQRPCKKRLSSITTNRIGPFLRIAMDQIYLTIALSSFTVLVGAYVLGVAFV
jgi:hypothetical protein